MERIIEPNQITNEDQCNESHCSQGSTKSSIHASLPNSNQQSTSRKGNRRRELKTPTPSSSRNAETMAAAQAESSQSARGTSPVEGQKGSSISDSDKDNEEMSSSTKTENRSVRKGKWAVEEEEYTSRVIQHFSAGLLTLPDGATLRSYLAEKLNCDPMRITKKFTGACCLGRRVYHLRDRPRATPAELEMARIERDHLEQRFRMRIEHEQSGLPLSRRLDMLVAQPPSNVSSLYPNQHFTASNFTTGNTLSPWVQNFGAGRMTPFSLPQSATQGILPVGLPQISPSALQHNQSRWLFPGVSDNLAVSSGQPDPSFQLLNHLVTSWAVAQAAASLSSETLASLAAKSMSVGTAPSTNCGVQHQPSPTLANTQTLLDVQRQLRNAYEDQKKEEEQRQLRAAFEEERRKEKAKNKAEMITAAARKLTLDAIDSSPMMPGGTDSGKAKAQDASPTELLQKSYEAHLQMLMTKDNIREVQSLSGSNRASTGTVDEDIIRERLSTEPKTSTIQTNINEVNESEQPMPDEEAGTVLLGFLNSLRQSYEDAVERKSGDANVERPLRENENDRLTTPPESIHKDAELSSVIRDVRSETKRRGTKRSPNRNSDLRSPQDGDARYLSTAVSQFISNKGGRRSQRPASVTDISSGNSSFQQGEFSSSLEDSSDKTDPSSSEESDKEDPSQIRWQSKGPPRKRVKSFTVENLLAHSKRMSENSGEHKHFER